MQGPGTGVIARDVVLVGGGHAHVEVLRRFAMQPPPGVRVTVVSRDVDTPYSGMVPGLLAGHYGFRDAHIDLAALCRSAGARLIHARAEHIDPAVGEVHCPRRPPVRFDLASIDVGSTPAVAGIEGAREHALPVKPIDRFLAGWSEIEARMVASGGHFRVVTIGGGAGGVEATLALHHRVDRRLSAAGVAARPSFTIVSADAHLLPDHGAAVRDRMARVLAGRRIDAHTGRRVVAVERDRVICAPHGEFPCDAALLFTRAAAPPWLAESGLALDEGGFVRVSSTLQSVSHENTFAAGDVAAFDPRPLPKNGVYAVREGPTLADNLRAAAAGGRLRPFRPQPRTLALISTGDRQAVGSYGSLGLRGRWLWRVKNRIDRRWMRRYADLPSMSGMDESAMRCGGCGSKVPADVLGAVLDEFIAAADRDDAVVLCPPEGARVVQSVDQFRSFVDDPFLLGRITAHHCLNDLLAMGARPATALAIATLPFAADEIMARDLRDLLRGAAEVLVDAGARLAGGHTGEGAELAFGLAVSGYARSEALLPKNGLRPGQALVLTKAVGTGVVLAADMRGAGERAWLEAALETMQISQARAADIVAEHGATACTDVTGFGLLGHLAEMVRASQVHAVLLPEAVPVLPGVSELAARGIESTLQPANERQTAVLTDARLPREWRAALFDPQTAGGLLAGVPGERAGACVEALRAAGYADAATIGEVVPGKAATVTLMPGSARARS